MRGPPGILCYRRGAQASRFVGHGIPVGLWQGVPYRVLGALSNLFEGTGNIRMSVMPEMIKKEEFGK